MTYDLIDYFNKRFTMPDQPEMKHFKKKPGPFVTISRETGCGANEVAELIIKELRMQNVNWKLVNKEIIYEAAKKLKVDTSRIYEVVESDNRTTIHEILDALSNRYYKNDRIIRKNVKELLRFDAMHGNVVIVGRGGVAVTNDIPNGLHVKLTAPLEWRIKTIMETRNMSREDAKGYINETDKRRIHIIEQLSGKEMNDIYFDVKINRETFSKEKTASLILNAMEIKGLI